jgi:glycosyltransferase involved in cell wall biosynthesis
MPKISVVVPAYNVCNYIEDTLKSLECQTFQDFEVLIVNDGSTDNTANVVQPFVERDSRFKLLHKKNGGLSSARNYGINYAVGEYIALLDGDDTYHPDKLANHVGHLEQNPDVGVVYSASRAIRDDGRPTFITLSGKPVNSDPLLALLCKNFIGHGSNGVFRRSLVSSIGEFDETLRSMEDIDFWLRVAATRQWKFYREKRVLCYYRVRPSGLSFNVAQMELCSQQVIHAAYHRSPELVQPILETAYAYMYRLMARLCIQSKDTEKARYYIDQAFSHDKSIFFRDVRSLITLIAVHLAPLTKFAIGQSLGSLRYTQK